MSLSANRLCALKLARVCTTTVSDSPLSLNCAQVSSLTAALPSLHRSPPPPLPPAAQGLTCASQKSWLTSALSTPWMRSGSSW